MSAEQHLEDLKTLSLLIRVNINGVEGTAARIPEGNRPIDLALKAAVTDLERALFYVEQLIRNGRAT